MADSWQQLNAKDHFNIQSKSRLSNIDEQVLSLFYEPIIGPVSFSLINWLWTHFQIEGKFAQGQNVELLKTLNVDLPTLYEARTKLEAAGLLRTYVSGVQGTPLFIFELIEPLKPDQFFQDDLLSILLLDIIGEDSYKNLANEFILTTDMPTDSKDISKSFLEIFHVASDKLQTKPDLISNIGNQAQQVSQKSVRKEIQDENDFDFQFLAEILQKSYVDTTQLNDFRTLILTEHMLYGLDETAMAKVITAATDIATNKFNPNRLKTLISEQYERQSKSPVHEKVAESDEEAVASTNENSFSAKEVALLNSVKSYDPVDFLNGIKQETGGFVTSGEQRILRELVSRQLFSTATVNVMIFYILNDRALPTLNKNLVDTIANDWSRSKVNSPESALAEIHNHQKGRDGGSHSKKRTQSGAPKRVETLPDWAKDDYTPKQPAQSLSKAEIADLDKQLSELQNRNSEEKGD